MQVFFYFILCINLSKYFFFLTKHCSFEYLSRVCFVIIRKEIILVLPSTIHILPTTSVPAAAAAMRHHKCMGYPSLHSCYHFRYLYELLQIFNPTFCFFFLRKCVVIPRVQYKKAYVLLLPNVLTVFSLFEKIKIYVYFPKGTYNPTFAARKKYICRISLFNYVLHCPVVFSFVLFV